MIRLFIADDHSIVREGLKFVVAACRDIEVVGEAEDAASLFAGVERLRPDVALVDVTMPGPGIIEVIRRLKSTPPAVRVLVLSMHPEKYYAKRVLSAGADGYLTKSYSAQTLPGAVRQVHQGRKYVTPAFAEELADNLMRDGRSVHEALSNREYEVFLRIGAGKSVDSIAQELELSPKTVRTYRSRIVEKTNLRSTAELIYYAVNKGLVGDLTRSLEEEPDEPVEPPTKTRRAAVARSRVKAASR
jgi:two-component system invasion response regulator UvrY